MLARQLFRLVRKNLKPRLHAAAYFSMNSSSHSSDPSLDDKAGVEASLKGMPQTLEELVFYPMGRRHSLNDNDEEVHAAFEAAIKQLNSLQCNEIAIRNSIENPMIDTVADTIKYLERSGLALSTVEKLSFIHVAGTKGKGSTCALTESILRHHGAHTGFFSSPHILFTNERIRIDGEPLAKEKFTYHFWKVFNRLNEQREHEYDLPAYFKFLTILSFHVFVAEKVDVAVMEVGIGGEQDSTNIVRNIRTVGITSLGLEHTELLGRTLKDIAWQKAGIIKPGSHVFTHVSQPECLQVIHARAKEQQAKVYQVPRTEEYFHYNLYANYLDSFNNVIRMNGSLAMQLAYDWLNQTTGPLHRERVVNEPKMCSEALMGLRNTHWPGRCQLVEFLGMRLHLDGAHTVESIEVCTEWFRKSISHSHHPRILIFNRTGESDITNILEILNRTCHFDMVCFAPNLATLNPNIPSQVMVRFNPEMQLKRAHAIAQVWQQVNARAPLPHNSPGQVYKSLLDVFTEVRKRFAPDIKLDVLVTGSIHLLGAAIASLKEMELKPSKAEVTNGH